MEDEFTAFLDKISPDDPRIIVRWVHEMRAIGNPDGGVTVGPIIHIIATARGADGAMQQTFEGMTRDEATRLMANRGLKVTLVNGNNHR